jgi:hypothetical protein
MRRRGGASDILCGAGVESLCCCTGFRCDVWWCSGDCCRLCVHVECSCGCASCIEGSLLGLLELAVVCLHTLAVPVTASDTVISSVVTLLTVQHVRIVAYVPIISRRSQKAVYCHIFTCVAVLLISSRVD